MGLLIPPPFAEPYYFHRVQLLGYKSPMPIALCRITLKMALDFQMTWVKKDNSLTVLRGNTWRFFNSVLGVVLVLCYWNRFNMYGLFSPLTGKAAPGICRYLGSWPSTLFVAKHMQTPGSLLIQLG